MKDLKKQKDPYETAIRFLSFRQRSEFEVREKLRSMEFNREQIDEVVAELKQLRYIDDSSFAENFVNYCRNRGMGKFLICVELEKKGIERRLARDVVEELVDWEAERDIAISEGHKAVSMFSGSLTDDRGKIERKLYEKIMRRLIRKGFSRNVCEQALQNIVEEIEDGIL